MEIFDILLSWLQDNGILPAVDRCGVKPDQAGLFPLGVQELSRNEDVLGNIRRRARYSFLLRCTAIPGEDAARMLLRLLELGGDTPERAPAVREDDRASRINRFIEDHLSEDTGIDQLAAHMHLSRRQMVRVVREIYGIGFREKLLYARMDRASWLLRTTTDTISRIVETVGYQSQTAFQRAFREHFGMTPTQYRRQFSGESSKE